MAAKPGVEQRQKDEKRQREEAASKIRAMRAEATRVRVERELKLAEERRQGKVIAGPNGEKIDDAQRNDGAPAYSFDASAPPSEAAATPAPDTSNDQPPPVPPKKSDV